MNFQDIQTYCKSLPGTTTDLKWENDLCFCVGEKMYVVAGVSNDPGPSICFKTTQELSKVLITREGIKPAPYLARYYWVVLETPDCLPADELKQFIKESYDMVRAKLPARIRKQLEQ